jgi:hypothetical protein
MTTHAVTAVRRSTADAPVEHVRWAAFDQAAERLLGEPAEAPLSAVLAALKDGDTILALYPGDDTSDGQPIVGPHIRALFDDLGRGWIDTDPRHSEVPRTLDELPTF